MYYLQAHSTIPHRQDSWTAAKYMSSDERKKTRVTTYRVITYPQSLLLSRPMTSSCHIVKKVVHSTIG